jgi:hypothetical protein
VFRSDAARAITRKIGRTWRRVRPFSSVKQRLSPHKEKRREHNMRLFWSLASDRLGSRHLMFGVETLLALTLCLLVLQTVTQL